MKSRLATAIVFFGSLLVVIRGIRNYAPLTEGWWHVYVQWINQGKVPYRDFELLVPPGYPYLLRLTTLFVGEGFLALRVVGAIQFAVIGVCVYLLIRRFAPNFISGLIAISSVGFLSSGTAFISYDYVYTALLLMLVVFCGLLNLEIDKSHSSVQGLTKKWIILGFFLGLAISIKQTQALAVLIGVIIILLIYNWRHWKNLSTKVFLISLGVGTVWLPIFGWFFIHGVSPVELLHAIYGANEVKGSLFEVLFGWIRDIFLRGSRDFRVVFASSIGILQTLAPWVLAAVVLRLVSVQSSTNRRSIYFLYLIVTIAGVAAWFSRWDSLGVIGGALEFLYKQYYINIFVGSWFAIALFAIWANFSTGGKEVRRYAAAIFVIVISVVWACGMSAGITEIGVFLAGAVGLSLLVYVSRHNWIAIGISGLTAVAVLSSGWWGKEDVPYAWWGYQVPALSEASATFSSGLMQGLRTSPAVRDGYSELRQYLTLARDCPGEILAYPHIPVVLLDSDLTPSGQLGQYWYDFSSTEAIKRENERLMTELFSLIIFLELPEYVLESHEDLFNRGNSLSHRELEGTIRNRVKELNSVVTIQIGAEATLRAWVSDCVFAPSG